MCECVYVCEDVVCVRDVCVRACVTHTPAAIHSMSNFSPRSTILELSFPEAVSEGERNLGLDSGTLRPGRGEDGD